MRGEKGTQIEYTVYGGQNFTVALVTFVLGRHYFMFHGEREITQVSLMPFHAPGKLRVFSGWQ